MRFSKLKILKLSEYNSWYFSLEVRKCLIFLFLVVYGVFSHGPSILNRTSIYGIDFIQRLLYESLLIICLAIVFRSQALREKRIILYIRDLYVTVFILMVLVLNNKELWELSLSGDESHYSQDISNIFIQLFVTLPEGLNSIEFKHIINFSQLFLLLTMFALNHYLIPNIKKKRFHLLILGFLAVRIITVTTINAQYQYLQGYSIFNSLFSLIWMSTTTFRLGSASIFVYLAWKLFDNCGGKNLKDTIIKLIFTLSVLHIPIFIDSLFVIDTTGYFIFIGGLILQKLIRRGNIAFPNLIILICVAVTLRATVLVFVPILIVLLIRDKVIYKKSDFMPIFLILPFIENLLFRQTIALFNDSGGSTDLILSFNVFVMSLKNLMEVYSILIILFALAMIISNLKYVLIIGLYICSICIFYIPMLPLGAVGHPKYPLEVLGPIILLGLYILLECIFQRNIKSIFLISLAVFSFLFSSNALSQKLNINNVNSYNGYRGFEKVRETLIIYPNDIESGFKYIRENDLAGECYNPGVTFGVFNQLLAGYSYVEYKEADKIYSANISKDNDAFNVMARNSCLVLTTSTDIVKFESVLNHAKWGLVFEDITPGFKTKVQIWKKSDDLG